jgi:hypothetical protein
VVVTDGHGDVADGIVVAMPQYEQYVVLAPRHGLQTTGLTVTIAGDATPIPVSRVTCRTSGTLIALSVTLPVPVPILRLDGQRPVSGTKADVLGYWRLPSGGISPIARFRTVIIGGFVEDRAQLRKLGLDTALRFSPVPTAPVTWLGDGAPILNQRTGVVGMDLGGDVAASAQELADAAQLALDPGDRGCT